MEKNKKIFADLTNQWEEIKTSSQFNAEDVKRFRESVAKSREFIWDENGKRIDELSKTYHSLTSETMIFLLENGCDDLGYLYQYKNAFGKWESPGRLRLIEHIVRSGASVNLLISVFYEKAFETEELARKGVDQMIDGGVSTTALRWIIEDAWRSGCGAGYPSEEHNAWLSNRISEELLKRGATRRDLITIIRTSPKFQSEAWQQLRDQGFLLGTLTKMIRVLPDSYAKFAWDKILIHDATPERMKKIIGYFNPGPKYVQEAQHWLNREKAQELLGQTSPTRKDLLWILRHVPDLESKAWELLKERGFHLGTLTKLVREFPDEYAKFAWDKILIHDATVTRMEKISAGFSDDDKEKPNPTYVKAAKHWLLEHAE